MSETESSGKDERRVQPKPKGGKERESYANFNLSEKVRLVDEYLKIPEKLRNLTIFARHHGVKRKTFNTWVDNRRAGKLVYSPEDIKRNRFRTGPYETVGKHLVEYINLRKRLLSQDKIGLDWAYLKMKALKIAEKVLSTEDFEKFRASDGFIHKCLKRNDLIGVTLHGEGNEMSSEQLDQELRPFRIKIGEIIDHHNIPLERIYNADAYSLFYMKLPNRIYCNPKSQGWAEMFTWLEVPPQQGQDCAVCVNDMFRRFAENPEQFLGSRDFWFDGVQLRIQQAKLLYDSCL